MDKTFIYGKDSTARVVSVETRGRELHVFQQHTDGCVEHTVREFRPWALGKREIHSDWQRLDGSLPLAYRRHYSSWRDLIRDRGENRDLFVVWDQKENQLIDQGITYYKGMRLEELSVLSFDIETVGLEISRRSKVLLISNTFRAHDGTVTRKLFALDDYADEGHMLDAWCVWVRSVNPSLVIGHNIYSYDLPYLMQCAANNKRVLDLGRDESPLTADERESKFRRDATQFYTYNRPRCFGRELIDTFFLAIKYDVARRYESYRLKQIIKQEGLERPDRQHYDAGQIAKQWTNPDEWAKIKAYAEHDADDALTLFDLMAPSYFYLCQAIPQTFEQMICRASGAQLNSFLLRSYLQLGHSVPEASEAVEYEGAISLGHPGVYGQCFKVDVASLYPSIMLEHRVCDDSKDPRGHFLTMVDHFTAERLANKKRAKDSGDRYYTDLEQSQKIVINSAYGMLGTPGLQFNSPAKAAFITRTGRDILTRAMEWATNLGLGISIVNADTDSIMITCPNGRPTDEQRTQLLTALNALYPARIRWEDDGVYDAVLVLKAKNYVLQQGSKLKYKGSALKATLKEPALQEFIKRLTVALLERQTSEQLLELYNSYAHEILNLTDIRRWASKKTVTQAVLDGARTTEAKVRACLPEGASLGDKLFVYFNTADDLQNADAWTGNHSQKRLLEKLHATVEVFETVLDVKLFPNYALKREKSRLESLA